MNSGQKVSCDGLCYWSKMISAYLYLYIHDIQIYVSKKSPARPLSSSCRPACSVVEQSRANRYMPSAGHAPNAARFQTFKAKSAWS